MTMRDVMTVAGMACIAGMVSSARAQLPPQTAQELHELVGARIEALTLYSGDYGLASGQFRATGKLTADADSDTQLNVTKLGGSGDIGDPQPIGDMSVGWQPHLQGNMGYIKSANKLHSPLLDGDLNTITARAVEFGGGARLWMDEHLSFAPTILGLYGRTSNSYTANSAVMKADLATAKQKGLIDWQVDTWTAATGLETQYELLWDRTIVTLSITPTWFHTETAHTSNPNTSVHGDSGSVAFKVDFDVPLGAQLFGQELRSGGYVSRTDLFGGLRTGLNLPALNEVHGRVSLDYLGQLWKVQWLGLGASYVWGEGMKGWTAGADLKLRF
jgi:hypothetical protein